MFFVLFSVIEEPIPVNRIDKGDFEISELLKKGIYTQHFAEQCVVYLLYILLWNRINKILECGINWYLRRVKKTIKRAYIMSLKVSK